MADGRDRPGDAAGESRFLRLSGELDVPEQEPCSVGEAGEGWSRAREPVHGGPTSTGDTKTRDTNASDRDESDVESTVDFKVGERGLVFDEEDFGRPSPMVLGAEDEECVVTERSDDAGEWPSLEYRRKLRPEREGALGWLRRRRGAQ